QKVQHGGPRTDGARHLLLLFHLDHAPAGGLALPRPARDMELLRHYLVLHTVCKWEALHLVRIVAGDARAGTNENGAGRAGCDERALVPRQLRDAVAYGLGQVSYRNVVSAR